MAEQQTTLREELTTAAAHLWQAVRRVRLPRLRSGVDPVTGDTLSAGEMASWRVQGVIRRWSFLGVITALTAYVWIVADPIWRHPLTDVWNLWASFLAIVIEGVTAMALINQTRRDACVIREIRAMSRHIEALAETLLSDVETLEHDGEHDNGHKREEEATA